MGELKVQMLGGFALRMNGQELLDTDTRSKKAWILLAYLISQREYTVSQKKLIDLLWGEEPNSVNPENALRITMHRTRALLEQFFIRFLVTKDGGAAGGFAEKAQAAADTGVQLIVIRRPAETGETADQILTRCMEVLKG